MRNKFASLVFSVFVLVLGMGLVGCDSNDDGASDAELFVGSWTGVSAVGNLPPELGGGQGDYLQLLGAGLDADFAADGTFSWLLDYSDPEQQDVPLGGSYTVTEASNTLTLTGSLFPGGVVAGYDFSGDDRVALTIPGAVIGAIVGVSVDGDVVLTLDR